MRNFGFPPGEFGLGEIGPVARHPPERMRDFSVRGDRATLRCRTTTGISNILRLTECENVSISGLDFTDDGLGSVSQRLGAAAIQLSG